MSPFAGFRPTAPARHAVAVLLLLLGAVLVAYRETLGGMVAIWSRSDTFAHGFLVLPIVLWLIWRKRDALAALSPQACVWALLPMAGLAIAWLFGDLASVNALTQFAMTGLLVLAVPVVLGLRIARVLVFPLAFLFFAVPFGEFLLPRLMDWTADVTVFAVRASGIPALREGNRLVVPSGAWLVLEACSGVRYLLATLMVGTLFAYLQYRTTRRRLAFVALSIVVPIVANWIRAYMIVMLGHLSDNKLAVGVDHLIYGWLFFGVVIGLMFVIGRSWKEPVSAGSAPSVQVGVEPVQRRPLRIGSFWATALCAFAILLLPHLLEHAIGEVPASAPPQLATLSTLSGGWTPKAPHPDAWKPAFQQPSAELNAVYSTGGRNVGVYIAYYRQQDHQRKLVNSENEVVNSRNLFWSREGSFGVDKVALGSESVTVRSTLLRSAALPGMPEQRLRVWEVYWVADRLTSSEVWAKVLAVIDRLQGHGDDAAGIVLYTLDDRQGSGRAALESFARSNLAAIVSQLRATRDGVRASVAANSLSLTSRGERE